MALREGLKAKNSSDYLGENTGLDDDVEGLQISKPSEVSDFFEGQNVLITGASGFVGKLLIEKLLRSCEKMDKLYIMMRPKKGKTAEERFKETFEDPLYARLKKERPDFWKHLVMIESDTGLSDLGLSSTDREMLVENTNIVFHCAATVRFDEKIRQAININVRGTKLLLLMAKEMKNLKSFVHVSTAFTNCIKKHIEEIYYDPPRDAENMLKLMDLMDDDELQEITPGLLGVWPNTYAFSKILSESIVRQHGKGLPTCIVRPSIMIATYREPVPGWINNLYGPTGVVVGAGIGLLRCLHCHSEKIADIIPADYVINQIIVASWDTAKTWPEKVKEATSSVDENENFQSAIEPPIYNSVSSCQKPINWGTFMHLNEKFARDIPSEHVIWHCMFFLIHNLYIYNVCIFFLHTIPAIIVDNLAKMVGREPILVKAYQKIHKFSGVIAYFCTQQWSFSNENTMKLWERTSQVDREKFDFNLDSLDWEDFFFYHVRGLRVFLIKDPLTTVEVGRRKYRKLQVAHYSIMTVVCLLFAWVAFVLLRSLSNFLF